jgi:hypothetical protein
MNNTPFIFHDLQDSQIFALAQIAGKQGFDVVGTLPNIHEAEWVKKSRYIQQYFELPSLGDTNMGLYALSLKRANLSGVFVPIVDDIAILLAQYAPLLRKNGLQFLTVNPEQLDTIDHTMLQHWQGKLNIPHTIYCSGDELVQTAVSIGFPVIIKSFRDGFIAFSDKVSMQTWLAENEETYPFHFVQRVQQFITGNTSKMASALLLFDEQSRPVRGFTARRTRVAQTLYGSFGETVAAQAEWLPDLYDAAVELLTQLGWVGFAEVECKQDENGQWHLLEINTRLSGWACFAEADGVDFLKAYYQLCTEDKTLEPCCPQRSATTYTRTIASSKHQPDWENLNLQTYKKMLKYPDDVCYGAWQETDPLANKTWVKHMQSRCLSR